MIGKIILIAAVGLMIITPVISIGNTSKPTAEAVEESKYAKFFEEVKAVEAKAEAAQPVAVVEQPVVDPFVDFNEHERLIISTCRLPEFAFDMYQCSYALATARHETAQFRTLKEFDCEGQATRLNYQGGARFCGRGYVQLTHESNYKNWSKWLGVDLVANPEILETDKSLSAKILVSGLKFGSFTGANKGVLSDYVNTSKQDYNSARRLINGDWWNAWKISGYASDYQAKLQNKY